jgi:hypothetical protein
VARKRLIKGANASRVEERIARVPSDLVLQEAGPSIFGALRALEGGSAAAQPETLEPEGLGESSPIAKFETRLAKKANPRAAVKTTPAAAPNLEPSSDEGPASRRAGGSARLRASDFTAAEREAIVRCCSDYRNHLPTYLLSVQKEVKIIDSVIDKCKAEGRGRG